MTSAVTVYTTGPECHKCNLTKSQLAKGGVEFTEVRVDLDKVTADAVKARGYLTSPVVHVAGDGDGLWWEDFRIDKVRWLISQAGTTTTTTEGTTTR